VINVDGHPAYARAIAELKQSGDLAGAAAAGPPYLNNIIEQDHRFIKKRIAASLGFRSAEGHGERALRSDASDPQGADPMAVQRRRSLATPIHPHAVRSSRLIS
jgi:hypothetical protein